MSYRVIAHEPVCPDCGSADTSEEDVETGDGLTETALICRACGSAWPVACVTDWDPPARRHPYLNDRDKAVNPHVPARHAH